MSNKYKHDHSIRKFYYQPDSHYCAIVVKDDEDIKDIREKILGYFLHETYQSEQTAFFSLGRGKLSGALLYTSPRVADFLIGENYFENVSIVLSPINLEEFRKKKIGLQRLVELTARGI